MVKLDNTWDGGGGELVGQGQALVAPGILRSLVSASQEPILCSAWYHLFSVHQEYHPELPERTAKPHPLTELTLISGGHGLQGLYTTKGPGLGPAADPGMDSAGGIWREPCTPH